MRYVDNYKLFERKSINNMSYDDIMGKILHLYGSIPLFKQKSDIVIKKILYPNYYNINNISDIDLTYRSPHDKARFVDYFNSLISAKDTRGDNFEGFLAGIYNGKLSSPFAKYDLEINDKTWSVKFVDIPSKAPEIGSYQKELKEKGLDEHVYLRNNPEMTYGLRDIFKSFDNKLKEQIWYQVISSEITGGWLIAYPIKTNDEFYIRVNKIDVETMKHLLMEGHTTSPKGGYKSIYSLAISSTYRNFVSEVDNNYKTQHFNIIIPQLTLEDLKKIYINEDEEQWGYNVFGKTSNKIRPDVLRYIKKNQDEIITKLLKFNSF